MITTQTNRLDAARARARWWAVLATLMCVALMTVVGARPAAAAGERVVWQTSFRGATVQLWYNNGYNWVSVSSSDRRGSEAGIYSPQSGWRWSPSYGSAPTRYTTPAVYAPGATCVSIRVTKVSNSWPHAAGTGNWRVC